MNKYNHPVLVFFICLVFIGCQSPPNWERTVENIHLEWELVNNFAGESDQFEARFDFSNQSDHHFGDEGWSLFFNMSPRRILEAENADFEHINGDWYRISPKEGFHLPPGEAISITYKGIEGIIKETDAPMGLYFVFDDDGNEEEIVTVKNWKVNPFVREEQLLRGPLDEESPYSPEAQFNKNEQVNPVASKDLLPIVPTPYYISQLEGNLRINGSKEITYAQGLENEAQYLSDKLKALTGDSFLIRQGDLGFFQLGVSDISVNGHDKEAYHLTVDANGVGIAGSDAAGVYYGIQSFLSLLGPAAFKEQKLPLSIPFVRVEDAPRFGFRSLHLDVSRNFQEKETIMKTLDLMSHYKLNHFLFYTTEDEGWRLEIPGLPELTSVGGQRQHVEGMDAPALHPGYGSGPEAYMDGKHGSGFFTREEFIDILKYAKARHITVIPELNFPGHARAAIKSMEARYNKLLDAGDEEAANAYRLIDPQDTSVYLSAQAFKDNVVSVARESTYRFYEKVVDELAKMYEEAGLKLEKMHAGGDEVPEGAWTASPMAAELLKTLPDVGDPKNLQAYFFRELMKRLEKRDLEVHVWEEMALVKEADGSYRPNPEFVGKNVVPYIWNNMFDYPDLGYQLANMGYEVVLCNVSNFYFDLAYDNDPKEPGLYWAGFVNTKSAWTFAPFDWFKTTYTTSMGKEINQEETFKDMVRIQPDSRKNIMGLEAQLWGETLKGGEMAEYYMFPKMLGFAESAWAAERPWETMEDTKQREAAIASGWNLFANTIAQREYPKMAWWNGGYNYRIAPPGAMVKEEMLYANVDFPGLEIRYTIDGTLPTRDSKLFSEPVPVSSVIKLRAFDPAGKSSREVIVPPK